VLRVNYRTSHQIRTQADQLLGPEVADVDGLSESRKVTISLFTGPGPVIEVYESPEEEAVAVGIWLAERIREGVQPHEMAVFVRSEGQMDRAQAALRESN
jgi:superfamily I DNA/RNA helicase